jgi:hypothetical protein
MAKLDQLELENGFLANGKIDGNELEILRERVYAGGKIDRQTADFLVELHKRVQHRTPGFEKLFYQALKHHILTTDRISAEQSAWLRGILFADGKIADEGRKFLHELKGEAKDVSREFEALYREVMKTSPEQHTCGG